MPVKALQPWFMSQEAEQRGALQYNLKEATAIPGGTNHLLVIGIDAYEHWPPLNNAVRDAKAFRDLLLDRYGFSESRTKSLFNKDATKDNILSVLRDYEKDGASQLTSFDNLLIYFSGHGSMNPNRKTGYWIPVAAPNNVKDRHKFLSNEDLKESIDQIGAHHIYIVSDACFAGSLITRSGGAEKLYENKPSRRVLTSGQLEKVLDGPPGGHSPFAQALLTCLREPDGEAILSQELEARVVREFMTSLEKLGLPEEILHRPAASQLTGVEDDGGQFVFRLTNTAERHWQQVETKARRSGGEAYLRAANRAREEHFSSTASKAELERYLALFPEGPDAEKARAALDTLIRLRVPEMVLVRGGTFMMTIEILYDEEQTNLVKVGDYYLGKFPVTVSEFRRFIEETGYHTDAEKLGHSSVFDGSKWVDKVKGIDWRCAVKGYRFLPEEGQHPVIYVSWNDAQGYCQWLREQTGQAWRLPTVAEWEYAAGGGESNRTTWAGTNEEQELGEYAWYAANSGSETYPVGQKQPNNLGLYDMSGNVLEWCEDDWYPPRHWALADGFAWVQSSPRGPCSVYRGGSWFDDPAECRVACRSGGDPSHCGNTLGFRVACSI